MKAIFTNTVPVDAVRGAGRPEASFMLERLVDVAARRLGIDPVEIRRKNFIQPDQFPYQTPVALQYDTGDYEPTQDLALELSDWSGFGARRGGRPRPGVSSAGSASRRSWRRAGSPPRRWPEPSAPGRGSSKWDRCVCIPRGAERSLPGSHSHGQGHETTFAQIVAEGLGIGIDQVEVVHGDTAQVPFGMGTYGSRSVAVGGSAIYEALQKIIKKGTKIAAHLMEASEADVVFEDGRFTVAGTDKSLGLADVSLAAYVPHNYPEGLEPGLEEMAFYDPKNFTYPAGAHVAEVEIDPETGVVELVAVCCADDVGRIINPMIVDGQMHGGLAHGIGQALLECCKYDDGGQLITGSYMNYCMPRAADLPFFKTGHNTTHCTHNPLGVKGVGEVGSIGIPPAVINAVVDALAHLGVEHMDMPATPERVWRAIQDAQASS